MKGRLSRPPYQGNMKVKGAKMPGVDDFREPDAAHRQGYDRVTGNEVSDYSNVMPPGKRVAAEVKRINSKRRRGRFSATEAAHALACRTPGAKGSKGKDAFFKSVGYIE